MSSLLRHFLISMCAAGLLIGVYHFAFSTKEIIVTPPATPMVQTSYKSPIVIRDSAENTDFTVAVDRTIDAVVHITNTGKSSSQSYSLWDLFYSSPKNYPRIGMGSGVIVSPDGYVITNNHVIEGCRKVSLTHDGKEVEANVIATDSKNDLAICRLID